MTGIRNGVAAQLCKESWCNDAMLTLDLHSGKVFSIYRAKY